MSVPNMMLKPTVICLYVRHIPPFSAYPVSGVMGRKQENEVGRARSAMIEWWRRHDEPNSAPMAYDLLKEDYR